MSASIYLGMIDKEFDEIKAALEQISGNASTSRIQNPFSCVSSALSKTGGYEQKLQWMILPELNLVAARIDGLWMKDLCAYPRRKAKPEERPLTCGTRLPPPEFVR